MLHITEHSIIVPSAGNVIIFWLGGAGFLIKYTDGFTICIDPYLSDSVERLFGFKRLHPTPINPDALRFDALFITHEHADHFDEDSIDTLMSQNPGARIYAPKSCDNLFSSHGIQYFQIFAGQKVIGNGMQTTVIKADHGDLSPLAVGYLFERDGHSIYLTGDTGHNEIVFESASKHKPDIILPCINGAFGNLDEEQAAQLVARCNSAHAIPMHFGLFIEHGGDAIKFATFVKKLSLNTKVHILSPGEGTEI